MCLNTLTKKNPFHYTKEITVYKVFKKLSRGYNNDVAFMPQAGTSRYSYSKTKYKFGKWYINPKDKRTQISVSRGYWERRKLFKYTAGFHAFKTYKAARDNCARTEHQFIAKCTFKHVTAVGRDQGCITYVAQEMRLDEVYYSFKRKRTVIDERRILEKGKEILIKTVNGRRVE